MNIARRPLTEKEETEGRIHWLSDLKETILDGKLDVAVDNISAAIKLLSTSTVGGDDRRKQPD